MGGPRYGWDPHTGQRSTKPNPKATPSAKGTSQATSHLVFSTAPQPSFSYPQTPNSLPMQPGNSDQAQGKPQRILGYKGKNFNPNHGGGYKRRDYTPGALFSKFDVIEPCAALGRPTVMFDSQQPPHHNMTITS
ncbi:hypothetical protein PGT21_024064 [Puccinia graminis f. sp. tritici]|uniref:Uncharacterized protein n=1 Tax=Puccinia graminis f. sp. tritici TaxID=56615 RepID=A0A5B0QW29_PUCGR|nr:hypothetical protein PGT21_024064 [Puccinia graminis f. sp. tritici]KAA1117113.1 hypothetical protein PGTUg99_035968 [Puccinia graminis f. sp. tritici]